jgi:FG-GAP repeat protein
VTFKSNLLRRTCFVWVCAGVLMAAPAQTPSQALAQAYEILWTIDSDPGGLVVVHAAGDLNLDDWDDVLLGEPSYNLGAGRVRACSGASGYVMWETLGTQSMGPTGLPPSELMGNAMAVLDWDADGMPDVAIGAPNFYNPPFTGTVRGRVRIVSGVGGSLVGEFLVPSTLQAAAVNGWAASFGAGLGVGGDLTGDGFEDLVVCVPTVSPTSLGFNAGAVLALEAPTGNVVTTIYGSVHLESPGCFSTYPEIGGTLILPGGGPAALGRIAFGSPVRNVLTPTGSLQYFWGGSLKVYDAGGGNLLLEVIGTGNYSQVGYQVVGHRDLDGDGYPDIAVLREPYVFAASGGYAFANPVLEIYNGVTLQVLYTNQVLPGPGLWPGMRVGLTPDVSGDGLADVVVTSKSVTMTGGTAYTWTKVYEGDTGTEIEAWQFGDPNFFISGYAGYESRVVGDVNNDGWGDLGVVHVGFPQANPSTLEIHGRRNLAVSGALTPGGQATLTIETPRHGNRPFLLLFSGASGPPLTVGPYVIPLATDAVFVASLQVGLVGTLDTAGNGSVVIPIPNDASLSGATIYASGVVVDLGSSYGVGTILTRQAVTIQ